MSKEITPEDSVCPVYAVEITAEQEAEYIRWLDTEKLRQSVEKQKATTRESALKKLTKLGLTDEEIQAIIGL